VKYGDNSHAEVIKAHAAFDASRVSYDNACRNSAKRCKRNADKVTLARDGGGSGARLSSLDEDRVFDRAYKRMKDVYGAI
jgi:UDP-glucose 6-dehydrogenase